jgi:hypothetical protein
MRLTHDNANQQDIVLHFAEIGAAHLIALEAGRVLGTLQGFDQTNREDDVGLAEHACKEIAQARANLGSGLGR